MDEALIKWVNKTIPIKKGFKRSEPEVVIPLSVKDIFQNYFRNDAPFSFDQALEALGYEFLKRTNWTNPDKAEINGEPVMATRVVKTRSKLPSFVQVTLAEHTFNERTSYLLAYDDKQLRIKEVSKPSGFPYAEQLTMEFYIEIYQPYEDQQKSVMRHVNKLIWNPQPWVLASIIERASYHKLSESLKQITDKHIPNSLEIIKQQQLL